MRDFQKKPVFWLGVFVTIVGMACAVGGGSDPTPRPEGIIEENTPVPTESGSSFLPTKTPAPTSVPGVDDKGLGGPEAYYVEEFEGNLDEFSYFLYKGQDLGSEMLFLDNGMLSFRLENRNTWLYVTYDAYEYTDVRIGMRVENRGVNSQRVSLVCRLSDDGWIEFNIGGDGLYEILAFNQLENKGYQEMASGGSTEIRLGKDVNEYVAECIGDEVALYVNGEEVRRLAISKDWRFLREGLVGLGVSSFEVLPVVVNIDWFGIEQP